MSFQLKAYLIFILGVLLGGRLAVNFRLYRLFLASHLLQLTPLEPLLQTLRVDLKFYASFMGNSRAIRQQIRPQLS